jgi:hypothetical protein
MYIDKNEIVRIQKELIDEIFSSLLNQSGTQLTREANLLIAWKRRPDKIFKINSSIEITTGKKEQRIIISVFDGSFDDMLLRVIYNGRIDTMIDCIIAVTK